jgi:hypothetical protein
MASERTLGVKIAMSPPGAIEILILIYAVGARMTPESLKNYD